MAIITATSERTVCKGLPAYYPALMVHDAGRNKLFVGNHTPHVDRKTALKYANMWRNESLQAGHVVAW